MRGGRKPVATGPEMVGIAGPGPADRQEIEHAVRDRRGRARLAGILQDVGQRLPRRLRRQDHATIAIEACTVTAAGARKISAGAPSMLRRSKIRDPRAPQRRWRGRETGMSAISCLLPPLGDESAGLLGQPCLRT